MKELLDKIHSRGYWRVLIRPTVFEIERISSLTQCKNIIEETMVLLRGWDYPHFDSSLINNNIDSIELGIEFMHHLEYWKFFQSGQFIHHFSCFEDYIINPATGELYFNFKEKCYLSILSTLYTITEIFQFTSRLILKEILKPNVELSIGLHGMQDRQLFFWERGRHLSSIYKSTIPDIVFNKIYSREQIIQSPAEVAMEVTIWIFERFNWSHESKVIFLEEQKKFLEKRL
jgi:hypothetical protein